MHVPPRSRGSAKALARESFVARRLVLPTQAFFHTEGPGGVLLLVCSLVALAIANCLPWGMDAVRPFHHGDAPWRRWRTSAPGRFTGTSAI